MHKTFIVFLAVFLLCGSIFTLYGCDIGEDAVDTVDFAVFTDIHVVSNSILTEETYASHSTRDKMMHLSDTIFQSMADSVIEKGYDFILIAGDLTESGDRTSHETVVQTLTRIENTGIDVYVINGNHDIVPYSNSPYGKITQADFAELYADFGYSDALSTLEGTLCYSCELNDEYRLIAIDNVSYYTDAQQTEKKPSFTDDIAYWANEQAYLAEEAGKKCIVLSHVPLLYHCPQAKRMFDGDDEHAMNSDFLIMCSVFAQYSTPIGFSGHNHFNDIKYYQNEYGNEYTDVQITASCCGYSEYYEGHIEEDVLTVTVCRQETINPSYIDESVPESVREELLSDFPEYEKRFLENSGQNYILSYIRRAFNALSGKNLDAALTVLRENVLQKVGYLPLYGEEESLEALVLPYGIELPQIEENNVLELLTHIYMRVVNGDEYITEEEQNVLRYAIYSLCCYLNDNAQDLADAVEGEVVIEMDIDRLFSEGKIDLYSSSCIDALFEILEYSGVYSQYLEYAQAYLSTNLEGIYLLDESVSEKTFTLIPHISDFFTETDLLLEDLIRVGIFEQFIGDITVPTERGDREIVIDLSNS